MKDCTSKIQIVFILALSLISCGSVNPVIKVDDNEQPIEKVCLEYTGEKQTVKFNEFIENIDKLDVDKVMQGTEVKLTSSDETKELIELMKIEDHFTFEVQRVGDYTVDFRYNSFNFEFLVEVRDTLAPVFINKSKTIEVGVSTTKVEILKLIKVEDLSKVSLDFDDTVVDFDKEGSYEIKVTAVDEWGNESSEKYKLIIIGKSSEENVSKEPLTEESTQVESTNEVVTQVSEVHEQVDEVIEEVACAIYPSTIANSGMVFSNQQEAEAWAYVEMWDESSPWYGYGWASFNIFDNCENEYWTVYFYETTT